MTQIAERMFTAKFLIASDWRSPVIGTRPIFFLFFFFFAFDSSQLVVKILKV